MPPKMPKRSLEAGDAPSPKKSTQSTILPKMPKRSFGAGDVPPPGKNTQLSMPPKMPERSLEIGDIPPPEKNTQSTDTPADNIPVPGPSVQQTRPRMYISDLKLTGTGAPLQSRVTAKSDLRTWVTENQLKKMFNFVVVDETGEITVTAFNNNADLFIDKVQVGKCYKISLYQTKPSRYARPLSSCEIHLTKVSVIPI